MWKNIELYVTIIDKDKPKFVVHGCLYVNGGGTMSKRSKKDIIDNRNELKKLIVI